MKQIPGIEKQVLVASDDLSPKNSEGSAITLKDGRILFTWTQFFDIEKMPAEKRPPHSELRRSPLSDDGYAVVSGMISDDDGRNWSERFTVADDRDACVNTMSPCLTRMQDGRILLAYSWRNGGNHQDNYGPCTKRVRISEDEGKSWSDPTAITFDESSYHTGCHDRAWTLSSGRVLVQCHTNSKTDFFQGRSRKSVYVAYSDDNGRSWQHSNELTEGRSQGFNEGCIAPRPDGSLLIVMRSWLGHSFLATSTDDGATWSAPRPSGVIAPDAPTYLCRLPDSDTLLMVWNSNWNPDRSHDVTRCPLLCAASEDSGASWGLPKAIETDPEHEWAYPGILFHKAHALLHYFRCPREKRGQREMILARIPIEWFTE